MNTSEFNVHMEGVFAAIRQIRAGKGQEYAHDVDQLANFKRTSLELGGVVTPESVCWIFGKKHIDSIISFVEYIQKNGKVPPNPSEPMMGRFHDAILYMILLSGLMVEREAKDMPPPVEPPWTPRAEWEAPQATPREPLT